MIIDDDESDDEEEENCLQTPSNGREKPAVTSVDTPSSTCAANSCEEEAWEDLRFCEKHMTTAWSRLHIPRLDIWRTWEPHLKYFEKMKEGHEHEHDHWILDCEHFTFPGCLPPPAHTNFNGSNSCHQIRVPSALLALTTLLI